MLDTGAWTASFRRTEYDIAGRGGGDPGRAAARLAGRTAGVRPVASGADAQSRRHPPRAVARPGSALPGRLRRSQQAAPAIRRRARSSATWTRSPSAVAARRLHRCARPPSATPSARSQRLSGTVDSKLRGHARRPTSSTRRSVVRRQPARRARRPEHGADRARPRRPRRPRPRRRQTETDHDARPTHDQPRRRPRPQPTTTPTTDSGQSARDRARAERRAAEPAGLMAERDDRGALPPGAPPGRRRHVDRAPGASTRAWSARSRSSCWPSTSPRIRQLRVALPPRGAGGRAARAPQHRAGLRLRPRRADAASTTSSWSTSKGQSCAEILRDAAARCPSTRRSTSSPGLPGPRLRAPPRRRASRRQAGQPAALRRRRRQARRLRDRQGDRAVEHHPGRLGARHRRLPRARAGARRGGRPARRTSTRSASSPTSCSPGASRTRRPR